MADARDAKLNFLIAECGIRQLYGRYADAVWRKDTAAFVDCFAEDAVWKIAGRTVTGRADIGALFEMTLVPSERVMMWVGIPVIELDGATATGRVQVTELLKRKDGSSVRTLALYYERYAEQGGAWRLKHHHFNLYYFGPPDLSESYYGNPEYGPPPGMPGPDDPTTVRR
jgi:uncharacterized protein (TIGR02246 family)